ncbi:GTPase IMAP family member 8-like isoform X2 [Pomacea canaliculata]|uniref:GTPase IMAP family member 8-like isoform X2 n=1 Tax=Pomacea canaliculata TaxID=400727 RepID=UPI000D73BBC1|nr:GTPase IMAP family member 8-like isoform X2 [Pomacea canaliculata]
MHSGAKENKKHVWRAVWTAAVGVPVAFATGEHSKKEQYRILIIGKTGNGKSSIANALLGQQKFAVGSTMASTTHKVQSEQLERDDCLWMVVDTPDPVNSELDTKQFKEEIQKWKQMTAPFPSAILLALRCDVRYTAEEYDIYKKIKNAWADKSFLDNLTIVFTFGDRQDKDLAEELKTVCPKLQNVLKDSSNNYVLFKNVASKEEMEEQVKELISRIKKTLPRPSPPPSPVGVPVVFATGEHSRILIIGKTGNGKSSIANALLGQQKFAVGSTMASTTLQVQSEQTERDNCLWTVVDTPDPVNSELDTKQLKEEIQKWKQMTAPFPSAILLAVRCDVRYTAEEYDIYKKIKNAWADKSFLDNLIIVFTFGDRQDKDLAEELKTVCPELKNVLRDSNNNYVLFNNTASEEAMEEQVKKLISIIKEPLPSPPPSPPPSPFPFYGYWLYILAFLGIAVASRKQPTIIRLILLSTPPALFVLHKLVLDK